MSQLLCVYSASSLPQRSSAPCRWAIDFSGTHFAEGSQQTALCQQLLNCTGVVERLHLCGCGLGSAFLRELCLGLRSSRLCLGEASLSGNPGLGDLGAGELH